MSSSTKKAPEILIISDGRPGNDSQLIGLARAINLDYQVIKISYNFLINLPNILLPSKILALDKVSKEKLQSIDFVPKFILSCGRRTALAALYLKEKIFPTTKIIQLMNPNYDLKKFDLVILPRHDFSNPSSISDYSNIILTTGCLNKIDATELKNEAEIFKQEFEREFLIRDQKKIALIIGGSSKSSFFDQESALKLANNVSRIVKQMNAILIVLTSRRTGAKITEIVKSNLTCQYKFFDWQKIVGKNPYLGILGYSDFFIVTADSVAMCSECLATTKPVYIFDHNKISSAKHKRFYLDLVANDYAKMLDDQLLTLENFVPKKLSQNKAIAEIINQRFSVYN